MEYKVGQIVQGHSEPLLIIEEKIKYYEAMYINKADLVTIIYKGKPLIFKVISDIFTEAFQDV